MGTNFYAVIPVKKRDKEKAKKLIDENKFKEAADFLEEITKTIHLGKRSGGWKFLFNANLGKYYELTREGINKFFAKNNVIIKDEYGVEYTAEEFWENEIGKFLEKGYEETTVYAVCSGHQAVWWETQARHNRCRCYCLGFCFSRSALYL